MTHTILATYDRVEDAHAAIDALRAAGFEQKNIGLAVNDPSKEYAGYVDKDMTAGEGASLGAGAGALMGALAGLVAITIPGVGPVIAAGPLSAALGALFGAGVGAASGAVTGSVVAGLIGMGVPEEDAHYYAEGLRRGSSLVAVTVHDNESDRAMRILNEHGPVDMDERMKQWRANNWEGFDPMVEPYTAETLAKERNRYYDDDTKRVVNPNDNYTSTVRKYPVD
ncbi:hypothetical protein MASR2M15_25940 [Anaerolineales bacterium]